MGAASNTDQATIGAYRVKVELAKWENHRTPADGPPDEVITVETWHEADGTEVTDPARAAVLESKI